MGTTYKDVGWQGDDHGECGGSRVGRDPRVKSFTVSSWL